MPSHTAVRGLRRAELLTHDPEASVSFYRSLLDWMVLQLDDGGDCWVGERRCATVRRAKAGERPGWRMIFAGAAQDSMLTGPDDTSAGMAQGRAQHGPWAPSPRRGEPCWIELFTSEAAAADQFWTDTLAWTSTQETDTATYAVQGRPVANRSVHATAGGQAGWLCYFSVDSLDRAVDQVRELGGMIADRMRHPIVGETVVVVDSHGGVCALTGKTQSWGAAS